MRSDFNLLRVTLAATGLLFLVFGVSKFAYGQAPVLLQVVNTGCAQDCDSVTTTVYADGRYVSEAIFQDRTRAGRPRKLTYKEEKELDPSELAELIRWAEQSDFLNAQSEYLVKTVRDSPTHFVITYNNKGREKKVTVVNFNAGNAAEKSKVPLSVMKLARWAQPDVFPN